MKNKRKIKFYYKFYLFILQGIGDWAQFLKLYIFIKYKKMNK